MRIFIMGEVGVGKSHATEHLAESGYRVIPDPVIQLGEEFLAGPDSLKIQLGVAAQLYLTAALNDDGIFDSCLAQSFQFVQANYKLGLIERGEYINMRRTYYQMIDALGKNDVFIYLHKPKDIIKAQIRDRGRPYEQNNVFIDTTNDIIRKELVDFTGDKAGKVIVLDVTEGYGELDKVIKELLHEEK